MNIDQAKPGPPDNRTTYSIPSLHLPEIEEPDHEIATETIQQTSDNHPNTKTPTQDTNPNLTDENWNIAY